MFSCALVPDC